MSDTARNTEYAGTLNPLEAHMVEVNGIFQAAIAMVAVLELKDAEQTPRPVILPRKAGGSAKKRRQAADARGAVRYGRLGQRRPSALNARSIAENAQVIVDESLPGQH